MKGWKDMLTRALSLVTPRMVRNTSDDELHEKIRCEHVELHVKLLEAEAALYQRRPRRQEATT